MTWPGFARRRTWVGVLVSVLGGWGCLQSVSEVTYLPGEKLPDGGIQDKLCGYPDGGNMLARGDSFVGPDDAYTPACTRVLGGLIIQYDYDSLAEFNKLRRVDGDLRIGTVLDLKDLSGLSSLEVIGGLDFFRLPKLTSLSGLSALRRIGGDSSGVPVWLSGLPALRSLKPLESVAIEGSALSISELDELESLDGLQGVTQLSALSIMYMPKLTSLQGLSSLKLVTGDVRFDANPRLSNPEIERLLSQVEVRGRVLVNDSPFP
jgi:hypothetical protein